MGAGSSCGGLGGKAGPHTSTVIGTGTAGAAIRVDILETIVVAVIRGTKPPPHRRGHGGMIIGYSTITGFVVIVLCLIILFIAICIASCSEHFKFSKQEQVIGGGRYISLFQSTRPSRGATRLQAQVSDKHEISIHAPLAGRD